MNTIKRRAITVVSLAAALGLLLLLSPTTTHSQTSTYSSPVRVTNTPLPVTVGNTSAQPVPTTVAENYYNATYHLDISSTGQIYVPINPQTNFVAQYVSVDCTMPPGQYVAVSLRTYTNAATQPHAVPLQYQGRFSGADRYAGTAEMKAFHTWDEGSGWMRLFDFALKRSDPSGSLVCDLTVDGVKK